MVDGYLSKLLNVVSGEPQCFGPVIVPLVIFRVFSILENMLIGDADDSTLIAIEPSPCVRVTVVEFLIHDLSRVSE